MTEPCLGLSFHPLDGPRDFAALADAVETFYAAIDERPDRVTFSTQGVETRAFAPGQLQRAVRDPEVRRLTLWSQQQPSVAQIDLHLRPIPPDPPEDRHLQPRQVSLTWSSPTARDGAPLRAFMAAIARLYPLAHGQLGRYRSFAYAIREALEAGANATELDPETRARLREDSLLRHRNHHSLRRLYPVLLIGPDLWARMPPLPAFVPMPTVEVVGDCRLLTAWPTLCEPRDPAFLRATRELRAWLWPYTIQNPADHVDRDPTDAG